MVVVVDSHLPQDDLPRAAVMVDLPGEGLEDRPVVDMEDHLVQDMAVLLSVSLLVDFLHA